MKARTILFASAACMAAAMSCAKEEPAIPVPAEPVQVSEDAVVFSASTNAITRTDFSDNGDDTYTILWKSGDQINVNGYALSLQTADQPDGYGPGYTRGNFSGPWAPTGNSSSPKYKVVYPASIFGTPGSLPTEQTYVSGDNVANFPMYAESDTKSFEFHNLCGIIRIGLKGDTRSVSSITLVDVDDTPKPMSGHYTISSNTAVISSGSAGTSLVCSPAVALNADDFEYFNITVPANTYGKLKIMIEATDGYIWTLTSKNAVTVERSMITPINLSSPKFKNEKAQITYTTYNNTKLSASKYNGGADASFLGDGLTIISHTFENNVGTITLSGDVTKIGDSAFYNQSSIVTITIPSTVTSIGNSAFSGCSKMTTCNIPSGVTALGNSAFQGCNVFDPAGQLDNITSYGGLALNSTALSGDLVLSAAVTKVDNYAFKNTKLSSVTFEGKPATMGSYIFQDCALLEAVTFEGDIAIPANMFDNCRALETVTFEGGCTSIGNNAFMNCKSLESFALPSGLSSLGTQVFRYCTSLASVSFPTNASFTTIPASCFDGCTNLASTSIPANVTSIQNGAFSNCGFTSLPEGWGRTGIVYGTNVFQNCLITSITFPDGWTKVPNNFCSDMKLLEEVNFGSGITTIGDYAFSGCTALEDVTLSPVLSTIQIYAFKDCTSLSSLTRPATMTSIGNYAFIGCCFTSLPSGWDNPAISYGQRVFENCPITSITFPGTWTRVPAFFCGGMKLLETVVISPGVTVVDNSAFSGCSKLSSVTLPEGLTTLVQYAFYQCTSLTSISLPSTLATIGARAFQESGLTALPSGLHNGISFADYVFANTKMTDITIPDGMTSIPLHMFSGCKSLTRVDLNDVTTLENFAFNGCSALATLVADNLETLGQYSLQDTRLSTVNLQNATSFGQGCFYNCTSLTSATLPAAVTLGNQVFYGNNNLSTVDIGSGITSIGNDCFRGCTSLTSLTVRATAVPSLNTTLSGSGAFNPTIYVPAAAVEDYKAAAVWSNYAERITAIVD